MGLFIYTFHFAPFNVTLNGILKPNEDFFIYSEEFKQLIF